MTKILILEGRFYDDIGDKLLEGAVQSLDDASLSYDHITLAGAFEIPGALSMAVQSGKYDGYLLLGCVIRGQTTHYDHICDSVFQSVQDLIIAHNLCIGLGVLTTENREQAMIRADKAQKNYGGKAVKALRDMLTLKSKFISDQTLKAVS